MKIILAVSIYPPDIGGPAVYSQKLKEGLESSGHSVRVVSYRGLKRFPQPLRIFPYFLRLFDVSRGCDLIYAFSLMSCALPAYFCRKKLAIRIGGDYLWERAVEAGKTDKSLRQYYEALPAGLKPKIIKKVLRSADRVIFTSRFQKDIYLKHFGIDENKTAVVLNPFPEVGFSQAGTAADSQQILYAGRFIKLKNIGRLINAFKSINSDKSILKIIGKGPEEDNLKSQIADFNLQNRVIIAGPMSQADLWRETVKSRFCVLPSLSEITPNFALECIKLGKPVLLTRETGFYEIFKDDLIFIDPFDTEDIKNKIEFLLDDDNLAAYIQKIRLIDKSRNWKKVIEENLNILENL